MKYVLEILVVLTTIGSWMRMYLTGGGSLLSSRGLMSLKYYTTLSNIFAGIAAVIMIVVLARTKSGKVPVWAAVTKFASAVTVSVTFLVTLFFLAPTMGIGGLYKGELMFMHAVGPVLTVVSFFMNRDLPEMKTSSALWATLPTILYGGVYSANIMLNGVGSGMNTNDWYGFAAAGIRTVPFVYALMMLLTYLLSRVMRKVKR
ncbi:MAG: hypothetical protein IKI12_01780 [Lachnospiraceae bacterium]|nr:hypothetical protein [Lachnospiraceae bacterium]